MYALSALGLLTLLPISLGVDGADWGAQFRCGRGSLHLSRAIQLEAFVKLAQARQAGRAGGRRSACESARIPFLKCWVVLRPHAAA